jgi:hypothetical protein
MTRMTRMTRILRMTRMLSPAASARQHAAHGRPEAARAGTPIRPTMHGAWTASKPASDWFGPAPGRLRFGSGPAHPSATCAARRMRHARARPAGAARGALRPPPLVREGRPGPLRRAGPRAGGPGCRLGGCHPARAAPVEPSRRASPACPWPPDGPDPSPARAVGTRPHRGSWRRQAAERGAGRRQGGGRHPAVAAPAGP